MTGPLGGPRPPRKVYAYLTRQRAGRRQALIFTQDDPAAGVQVPGGTVEPGESLAAAVRREVWEEAGLSAIDWRGEVAATLYAPPGRPGALVERHFFHGVLAGVPDRFVHHVTGAGVDRNLIFHYRWVSDPAEVPLIAAMGLFLDRVLPRP